MFYPAALRHLDKVIIQHSRAASAVEDHKKHWQSSHGNDVQKCCSLVDFSS